MMYHRKTPRAQRYDYSSPGTYFITICTFNRQQRLSSIHNGNLVLTEVGKIVDQQISEISSHRSNVDIHNYIVMPNHIHLLMVVAEKYKANVDHTEQINTDLDRRDGISGRPQNDSISQGYTNNIVEGYAEIVSLHDNQSKSVEPKPPGLPFGSLGYVINLFKGGCIRVINKQIDEGVCMLPYNNRFARQPRYHDYIVRDEVEYKRIDYYITQNPLKWTEDKFWSV